MIRTIFILNIANLIFLVHKFLSVSEAELLLSTFNSLGALIQDTVTNVTPARLWDEC